MSDVPVQDHWDGRMTFLFAIAIEVLAGFICYGLLRIIWTMWKGFAQ